MAKKFKPKLQLGNNFGPKLQFKFLITIAKELSTLRVVQPLKINKPSYNLGFFGHCRATLNVKNCLTMAKNLKSKLQFRSDFRIELQLEFFLAMLLVSKIV
jgi:hypothetical protein